MDSSSEAGHELLAQCRKPSDFARVAHTLLTSCQLVVQQRDSPNLPPSSSFSSSSSSSSSSTLPSSQPEYRRFVLSDVEFYHFAPDSNHPDPFAHAHDSQVHSGTWYFHAAGSGDGFKEGSYKGLDVTFGAAQSRSGILIRRMAEVKQGARGPVIDGPSLLCDAVLAPLGFSKVRDLVVWLRSHPSGCGLDAFHPQSPLRLELPTDPPLPNPIGTSQSAALTPKLASLDTLDLKQIWACPRHGLSLRKATHVDQAHLRLRLEYVAKPYRFLSARPKNGAINLAYGILQDLLDEHGDVASSSASSTPDKTKSARTSLDQFGPAIARRMYPELFNTPSAAAAGSNTAAQTRALRTVSGFLEHFERGRSKHPTAFAGSNMPTTKEVGELYGSLLDWDGHIAIKNGQKHKSSTEAASSKGKKRKHEDEGNELHAGQQVVTTFRYWVKAKGAAKESGTTELSPRALRALRRQ
ncbi:hypothetical protein OC846_004191 [Tilletia horrida]|uniref:Uncharacterized protein n=1 Tax=Tilletia horrida TaxID=155126 RepID=A0AAN6GN85_9BASI|nr:hypothetical protein OC846_004191 [Tilletia horrida]KAK0564511.1 hypothetical protein OC861_004256 [Tilletia horrida]